MSKTYVVLNGSPRPNGKVSMMLHMIADELERMGNVIVWKDVPSLNIMPCRGCMKCRDSRQCVLPQDAAHELARDIATCDGLILGSPVYWGNMSGQLKVLLDRIVPSLIGESPSGIPVPLHKGKRCALVVACSTSRLFDIFAGETRKAFSAMNEITHYSGFKTVGKLRLCGTKGMVHTPPSITRQAIAIAHRL